MIPSEGPQVELVDVNHCCLEKQKLKEYKETEHDDETSI